LKKFNSYATVICVKLTATKIWQWRL